MWKNADKPSLFNDFLSYFFARNNVLTQLKQRERNVKMGVNLTLLLGPGSHSLGHIALSWPSFLKSLCVFGHSVCVCVIGHNIRLTLHLSVCLCLFFCTKLHCKMFSFLVSLSQLMAEPLSVFPLSFLSLRIWGEKSGKTSQNLLFHVLLSTWKVLWTTTMLTVKL